MKAQKCFSWINKKLILIGLILLCVLITNFRITAYAASYPLVIFYSDANFENMTVSMRINQGPNNAIRFKWYPEYNHEKYVLKIYNSAGEVVASAEDTLSNVSSAGYNVTVTWNTSDYPTGRYRAEVTKMFYSLYRWNEAPTTSDLDIYIEDNSTGQIRSFVTRLYEIALNREPEESGLNDWTNKLKSGEAAAVNVVQGVLCSQEYLNKGKTNGEVVNDCYQAMLGRAADEAGYSDWVSRLDNGMSVEAIFAGFVGSEEFANLCNSYGINPGTYTLTQERDKNTGVTMFVNRLYTQALGRAYDVDGLNNWCGEINRDGSRNNILNVSTNGFFHSQEFINKNLSNTDFVKVLYRTFLGREYDDQGLADWVGQLDSGEKTRDQVMEGFAYSQEFGNIMAQYGLGQ